MKSSLSLAAAAALAMSGPSMLTAQSQDRSLVVWSVSGDLSPNEHVPFHILDGNQQALSYGVTNDQGASDPENLPTNTAFDLILHETPWGRGHVLGAAHQFAMAANSGTADQFSEIHMRDQVRTESVTLSGGSGELRRVSTAAFPSWEIYKEPGRALRSEFSVGFAPSNALLSATLDYYVPGYTTNAVRAVFVRFQAPTVFPGPGVVLQLREFAPTRYSDLTLKLVYLSEDPVGSPTMPVEIWSQSAAAYGSAHSLQGRVTTRGILAMLWVDDQTATPDTTAQVIAMNRRTVASYAAVSSGETSGSDATVGTDCPPERPLPAFGFDCTVDPPSDLGDDCPGDGVPTGLTTCREIVIPASAVECSDTAGESVDVQVNATGEITVTGEIGGTLPPYVTFGAGIGASLSLSLSETRHLVFGSGAGCGQCRKVWLVTTVCSREWANKDDRVVWHWNGAVCPCHFAWIRDLVEACGVDAPITTNCLYPRVTTTSCPRVCN